MLLVEALAPYDTLAERVLAKLPDGIPVFFVEEGVRDGGAGVLLGDRLYRAFEEKQQSFFYHVLAIDGHFASPDTPTSLRGYAEIDGEAVACAVKQFLGKNGKYS